MIKLSRVRCAYRTLANRANLGDVNNEMVRTAYSTWLLLATLLAVLPFNPLPAFALDNTIKISTEHSNNLGVTLGNLAPVTQVPVLYAPAKIVVPPTQEYIVSASQAGLVMKLNAAIGDKVKQGEVLATVNSSDLLSMQRLYLKASSELMLGEIAYLRDKKLFDEGVIPERRWQETHSQYNALLSETNEHKQLLEIAGMTNNEIEQLKKTRHLSGLLNIRSPITGVVMERMIVAGARIDSLTPLYRIANFDELWLEINIPQERIGQIKIGDKVLMEKPATETQELEQRKAAQAIPVTAHITLLGQSVNPENQTILVRAIIKGAQADVRPGQRINTQIIQPHNRPVFTVPNTAIAQQEGKAFVFVQIPEGFRAIPITVIGKQAEEATISGEFTGTETIAVKGAVALKANWLGLGSGE
ncbi:efflux RND transporter periplasmic adaptor subunit [Methylovulum sp.]|uniref:efflux RND transporter periplasmic adaptor subunit n=1 Tax=Methylovulum sp. TaxID=1916980 RepID=UPI0026104363|nr:efflux RND transporter periplasmic adaptor subunit [Methylovulum sp.]MDD5125940.1 efflux RND transporter periplasmic adaptor subunit [Methylovulum sp.]